MTSDLAEILEEEFDEENSESSLLPPEIVKELDRYIISQDDAKRAVAIAPSNWPGPHLYR